MRKDLRPETASVIRNTDALAFINLKARFVEEHNGIVTLEIPAFHLSETDRDTLQRLFPTFENEVTRLLNRELILAVVE